MDVSSEPPRPQPARGQQPGVPQPGVPRPGAPQPGVPQPGVQSPPITRLAGDPPSPWEAVYGYSRTVAAGPWVLIGGTTSVDPTGFVVGTTPYEQAVEILRKLAHELGRIGLGLAEVVQTRIYVTDISRADEVGRAHGEAFADAGAGGSAGPSGVPGPGGARGPVATMVEVSGLIDPRMLVEIELVAYRG